jgi:hypothetical protein
MKCDILRILDYDVTLSVSSSPPSTYRCMNDSNSNNNNAVWEVAVIIWPCLLLECETCNRGVTGDCQEAWRTVRVGALFKSDVFFRNSVRPIGWRSQFGRGYGPARDRQILELELLVSRIYRPTFQMSCMNVFLIFAYVFFYFWVCSQPCGVPVKFAQSVRMKRLENHWTNFPKILCSRILQKLVGPFQFPFRSDNFNDYFT